MATANGDLDAFHRDSVPASDQGIEFHDDGVDDSDSGLEELLRDPSKPPGSWFCVAQQMSLEKCWHGVCAVKLWWSHDSFTLLKSHAHMLTVTSSAIICLIPILFVPIQISASGSSTMSLHRVTNRDKSWQIVTHRLVNFPLCWFLWQIRPPPERDKTWQNVTLYS